MNILKWVYNLFHDGKCEQRQTELLHFSEAYYHTPIQGYCWTPYRNDKLSRKAVRKLAKQNIVETRCVTQFRIIDKGGDK